MKASYDGDTKNLFSSIRPKLIKFLEVFRIQYVRNNLQKYLQGERERERDTKRGREKYRKK